MARRDRNKQCKACKKDKSKKLMPIAQDPTRWQDWCMPEHEKKGIEPIFTDKICR